MGALGFFVYELIQCVMASSQTNFTYSVAIFALNFIHNIVPLKIVSNTALCKLVYLWMKSIYSSTWDISSLRVCLGSGNDGFKLSLCWQQLTALVASWTLKEERKDGSQKEERWEQDQRLFSIKWSIYIYLGKIGFFRLKLTKP